MRAEANLLANQLMRGSELVSAELLMGRQARPRQGWHPLRKPMLKRSYKMMAHLAAFGLAASLPSLALAQFSRAPDGEPADVAQQIIPDNFSPDVCPLVVDARRLGNGSITATCNNDETFRIFSAQGNGVAMRCAAARELGISGC